MGKSYSTKWLNHFRNHANAARDSVKEVTQVGACLIGNDNEVLLTAFNGPAIGVKDTPARRSRKDGLKYKYSSHAERNLIAFAARNGLQTKGLTIYATHHPCSACACEIVQAGISCVIVGHGQYKSADGDVEHAEQILREGGVQILEHKGSDDLERADALARATISHVFDAEGKSIYRHSVRVTNLIPDGLPVHYKIAAMLHDVVEDGFIPNATIRCLFGEEVADAIELLSNHDEESYFEYLDRLIKSKNLVAIIAKLADNTDNLDPDRLFDIEKDMTKLMSRYKKARPILLDAISPEQWNYLNRYGVGQFHGHKIFHPDPYMR